LEVSKVAHKVAHKTAKNTCHRVSRDVTACLCNLGERIHFTPVNIGVK